MTADVSCSLVEIDFAGIELFTTGWWMQDPAYLRYARLGMHAAVTGLKIGKPVDFSKSDEEVAAHLAWIKEEFPEPYDSCKRIVHGNAYGLTLWGMVEKFPKYFPTLKAAKETQDFYYSLAPGIPAFHTSVRKTAREQGFLGGPSKHVIDSVGWHSDILARRVHPYGYRHWFWDVLSYQPTDEFTAAKWSKDLRFKDRIVWLHGRPFKVIWGGDSNRVIAFYPQSIAAGVLKVCEWLLFGDPSLPTYIGDAYFGRTPLLGPIHDSLFLHLPTRIVDRVLAIVCEVMQAPIRELPCPAAWKVGSHLRIPVGAKVGKNWAPFVSEEEAARKGVKPNLLGMHKIKVPAIDWAGLAVAAVEDSPVMAREDDEQEMYEALERRVVA